MTRANDPEVLVLQIPEVWEIDGPLNVHDKGCRRTLQGITKGKFQMIGVYRNTNRCNGCAHFHLRRTTNSACAENKRSYKMTGSLHFLTGWLGLLDEHAQDTATRYAREHDVNYAIARLRDGSRLMLAERNLRPRGNELTDLPFLDSCRQWETTVLKAGLTRASSSKGWRRHRQPRKDWANVQFGSPLRLAVARRLAGFPTTSLDGIPVEVAIDRHQAASEEVSDLNEDELEELGELLNDIPPDRVAELIVDDVVTSLWATRSGLLVLNRARRVAGKHEVWLNRHTARDERRGLQ